MHLNRLLRTWTECVVEEGRQAEWLLKSIVESSTAIMRARDPHDDDSDDIEAKHMPYTTSLFTTISFPPNVRLVVTVSHC